MSLLDAPRIVRALTCIAFLGICAEASAHAWSRAPGSIYAEISRTATVGDRVFNQDFDVVDLGAQYGQGSTGLYVEAGIIPRWLTLNVSSEIYRENELLGLGISRTEGLGDTRLGLFSALHQGDWHVSGGLLVGIPTGEVRHGPDAASRFLPTGDGEWDFTPSLAAGTSFGGATGSNYYAQVRAGYMIRGSSEIYQIFPEPFADAIDYRFELGRSLGRRNWLIMHVSGIESFASNEDAPLSPVGLGNGVTYSAYGLKGVLGIGKKWSTNLGFDGAFRARSVVAAPSIRLGVAFES